MAKHHPQAQPLGHMAMGQHGPAMVGTHMTGMAGTEGHVDSAAGEPGYKPGPYVPMAGRADRLPSNIAGGYTAASTNIL